MSLDVLSRQPHLQAMKNLMTRAAAEAVCPSPPVAKQLQRQPGSKRGGLNSAGLLSEMPIVGRPRLNVDIAAAQQLQQQQMRLPNPRVSFTSQIRNQGVSSQY